MRKIIFFFALILALPLILKAQNNYDIVKGGIVRMQKDIKNIYIVFTGHEFADGGAHIYKTLKKHRVKSSFFFTGDFYRNKKFQSIIIKLKNAGHYLGAHSDRHLLYCDWTKRDSTLVSKDSFMVDLEQNYREMNKFGIKKKDALYFMPPYEWYNDTISVWANLMGINIVNFTPGTSSNADYTTPSMKNYVPSDTIFNRILRYEKNHENGLNGFILLLHIGTHEERTDKMYNKLDQLLEELKRRGYSFKSLKDI